MTKLEAPADLMTMGMKLNRVTADLNKFNRDYRFKLGKFYGPDVVERFQNKLTSITGYYPTSTGLCFTTSGDVITFTDEQLKTNGFAVYTDQAAVKRYEKESK